MSLLRRLASGCGCCLMLPLLAVAIGFGYFALGPIATHWVTTHSHLILHDAHQVAAGIHRLASGR